MPGGELACSPSLPPGRNAKQGRRRRRLPDAHRRDPGPREGQPRGGLHPGLQHPSRRSAHIPGRQRCRRPRRLRSSRRRDRRLLRRRRHRRPSPDPPARPARNRPGGVRVSPRPCRHACAGPSPGRIIDEASSRVHCRSPHTSIPLTCDPGRNGVLGLSPELHTQPDTTRPRTSGQGQARTLPGLPPWHLPASFDVLTHHVRPHVANNRLICRQGLAITPDSKQRK
jgi:hypothetical protein